MSVGIVLLFSAQKMKFSIKDLFSKCDQIRNFLWIWSHLMKKSLIENFIFSAVVTGIWKKIKFQTTQNTQKIPQVFPRPLIQFKVKYSESYRNQSIFQQFKSIDSDDLCIIRNSCPQIFFKIGVLKNFEIFTGKHLCWSLFLVKLLDLQLY